MEKRKNFLIAFGMNLLFYLVIFIKLDSIYYINDDVMIQDIISGAFLGEGSVYTIYMNTVLSGILGFLYGLIPQVSWYGLYFYGVYFTCTTWIVYRGMSLIEKKAEKIMAAILLFLTLILVMFKFMVLIHYTVIAAVLGGTGLFIFLTNEQVEKPFMVLKQNGPVVILLLLCFLTRSQVFFMFVPFLACAGCYRILQGKNIWKELWKYIPLIIVTGSAVLLLLIIDKVQYSSPEWKEYQEYNEARTELYDYSGIPEFETHKNFYETIGITKEQVSIIRSYNLLLDPSITKEQLQQIADYYNDIINQDKSLKTRVKYAFFDYVKRMLLEQTDTPYQYLVFLCYGIILVQLIRQKKWWSMGSIFLLGFMRSFIWIYLLFSKRFPERISVSLYTLEILLLIAIFLMEAQSLKSKESTKKHMIPYALIITLSAICLLPYFSQVRMAYQNQKNINREGYDLYTYMETNPDSFYLLDVYSVAKYSKSVFKDYHENYKNNILMGGWSMGMPLLQDKLQSFGQESAMELLLTKEHIFLVTDSNHSFDYIEAFMKNLNRPVVFHEVDRIKNESNEFIIYQIREQVDSVKN